MESENIFEEFDEFDNNDENVIEPLLSEEDLHQIIIEKKNNPEITKVESYTTQKKFVSSVIKGDRAKDVQEYTEMNQILSEKQEFITPNYKDVSTNQIDEEFNKMDIIENSPDDEYSIRNEEKKTKAVNDSFVDFNKYPKITGSEKEYIHGNLVPEQNIDEKNNTVVELSNSPNFDEHTHNDSVIEINRTEDGDILSIVVYCTCGEKTVINFDYYDPDDDDDESDAKLTEVIADKVKVKPFKEK
jgi:hypothetical protein